MLQSVQDPGGSQRKVRVLMQVCSPRSPFVAPGGEGEGKCHISLSFQVGGKKKKKKKPTQLVRIKSLKCASRIGFRVPTGCGDFLSQGQLRPSCASHFVSWELDLTFCLAGAGSSSVCRKLNCQAGGPRKDGLTEVGVAYHWWPGLLFQGSWNAAY